MDWEGDVCVVGAGVAGAAAALHLARRGLRVALASMPGPGRTSRWQTEVVPPPVVHALRSLAVASVDTTGHACRGVLSRWHGKPSFVDYELLGCVAGRAMRRDELGACLARHAQQAGAVVLHTDRLHPSRVGAHWELGLPGAPRRRHIVCRHLVDASGRTGGLRVGTHPRQFHDRAVCFFQRHPVTLQDPTMLLVDRSCNGWWYAVGAGPGLTDIAFVTDADLLPPRSTRAGWLATEFQQADLITSALDEDLDFTNWPACDARSGHAAEASGPQWLAIGDAALAWDPLSGHGMQYALTSATLAADAIADDNAEQGYPSYAQWWKRSVQEYEENRQATYRSAEHRSDDGDFWLRRRSAPPS